MSHRASEWVIYTVGPQLDDAVAWRLLMVMADQVDAEGKGCGLAKATLADLVRCDESTVRRKLRALEQADLIRPGDSRLVAYLPADKRPNVYDLALPAGGQRAPSRGGGRPPRRGAALPPGGVSAGGQRGVSGGAPLPPDSLDPLDPLDPAGPPAPPMGRGGAGGPAARYAEQRAPNNFREQIEAFRLSRPTA